LRHLARGRWGKKRDLQDFKLHKNEPTAVRAEAGNRKIE